MNAQAAAGFVLLHVVPPNLQEGEAAAAAAGGSGLKPLPYDGSRRPATLLQDAACRLQQHLDLPATKGPRPQLMVFRNLVPAAEQLPRATGGGAERPASPRLCPRHRRCPGRPRSRRDERVSELARDFGDFTVGPGREEWAGCECAGLGLAAASGPGARAPAEETSDAVLVLGAMEEAGAELEAGPGPGADCPLHLLCRSLGEEPPAAAAALGEADEPLSDRSRRTSLRSRLTKLFRARSCNGAAQPGAKRHSVQLQDPAGSPLDGEALAEGPNISKPRLTRTQSAFTPMSLAPPFTGKTVSLANLDISHRGPPSSQPLTPPPPPRRSLSLLVTLQRNSPQIRPMTLQPQHCPLTMRDSNSFAASLRELEKCGWYWGPMNWDDAEIKLKGKPDGSFLVRDSSDPRYILSLSFRSQGITHHTRMEHYRGLPPTPVQLLYPVSRFSNVKSLQHLCRFRIRQLVRIDHILELPLPKPLISYLSKFYYYDPEEETYLSLKEARLCVASDQDTDTQT
ncbi:suppressor of cytokine signaling 7-like isoform X2 [Narcine bancroftii]|uniref:suppressor of cytokine signaling 7-like isoform X2 n=1 Tax=Narcine bancroftii TaxID=1343680 RepID=UPI0038311CA3